MTSEVFCVGGPGGGGGGTGGLAMVCDFSRQASREFEEFAIYYFAFQRALLLSQHAGEEVSCLCDKIFLRYLAEVLGIFAETREASASRMPDVIEGSRASNFSLDKFRA